MRNCRPASHVNAGDATGPSRPVALPSGLQARLTGQTDFWNVPPDPAGSRNAASLRRAPEGLSFPKGWSFGSRPAARGIHEPRHRRIARQGQDHQQVPGARLPGPCLLWPCPRPALEERFGRSRAGLRHALGGRRQVAEAALRHRHGDQGRRPADSRHRPRSRGRGDLLARAGGAEAPQGARRQAGRARRLQRHHPRRHPRRHEAPARRSTLRWSMPISRAARSTISSASRSRRCCGASSPAPAPPAACSRWRSGWSATARTRSRSSGRRNTGRSPSPSSRRTAAASSPASSAADGEKLGRLDIPDEATAQAHRGGAEVRRLSRRLGRGQAGPAQSAAALHHLDPAAGGLAQARLLRLAHHAGRPAPLRGRPHHLYADRRRAERAGGDQRRPAPSSPSASATATCRRSRASTRPRRRTRRKPTRRSARPTCRARRTACAASKPTRRGSTS